MMHRPRAIDDPARSAVRPANRRQSSTRPGRLHERNCCGETHSMITPCSFRLASALREQIDGHFRRFGQFVLDDLPGDCDAQSTRNGSASEMIVLCADRHSSTSLRFGRMRLDSHCCLHSLFCLERSRLHSLHRSRRACGLFRISQSSARRSCHHCFRFFALRFGICSASRARLRRFALRPSASASA